MRSWRPSVTTGRAPWPCSSARSATTTGAGVAALDYSAHPSADSVAATIAARYAALPGIERIALAHRVGALVVGDLAIVAAVSSAHRGAAFQTCADLVEDVKAHLPIWKHQQFEDGTQEWVGIE